MDGRPRVAARSPITGEDLFEVPGAGEAEVRAAIAGPRGVSDLAHGARRPSAARSSSASARCLAEHKADMAELVTIEAGKIPSEALGEVQEMIDICDFAVGLSRQLDGRTMPSERPSHRLMETWHPLGVVAVISAFNFPAAVWSWNTAIALVCGDTRGLEAVADDAADLDRPARRCSTARPPSAARRRGSTSSSSPTPTAGAALIDSPDVALVSATGSERMGAEVAPTRRSAARPLPARAGWEQRGGRGAVGGPRARRRGHRVRRRRDGRASAARRCAA